MSDAPYGSADRPVWFGHYKHLIAVHWLAARPRIDDALYAGETAAPSNGAWTRVDILPLILAGANWTISGHDISSPFAENPLGLSFTAELPVGATLQYRIVDLVSNVLLETPEFDNPEIIAITIGGGFAGGQTGAPSAFHPEYLVTGWPSGTALSHSIRVRNF